MKIEITTSVKNVEIANMLLNQAIQALENCPQRLFDLGITVSDLKKAKLFRHSLCRGFLKAAKQ